jgi:hypothetical protein
MPIRHRIVAAIVVCALHLVAFVPTIGDRSSILENDFGPQAQAIKDGDQPYRDQDIEYPPLSIPVLVGPVYLGDSAEGFIDGFMWEMLAFDLAIVAMLALALPGDPRKVVSALGIYTVGIVMLSGVVLDPSLIDTAPLALSRFDLVPALLVLAAVLARDAGRSATWSAFLSLGAAVKAFPLLLYPALLRGETRLRRVAVVAAIPLLLCVAIVLVWGDEFGSAITYHTERALQVESLAASPFEVAHTFGANASISIAHGGYELRAGGADAARWITVVIGAGLFLVLALAGWRSKASNMELVTALVTVLVVFGPVLSPQFLLWILPVSAAAYGLRRENVVLLVAILFTQIALQNYDGVDGLEGKFVWPLAARNLYLLVYLWLICAPILRALPESPILGRRSLATR